jgi:hypothetical protein
METQADGGERASAFADAFGRNAFADAADQLTDDGSERLVSSFPSEFGADVADPEAALEAYWRGLYAQYGDFEGVGDVAVGDVGDDAGPEATDGRTPADAAGRDAPADTSDRDGTERLQAEVRLDFAGGSETVTVELDADGVTNLTLSPSYEVPDYVDPDSFTERGVTVDAGDAALDGVLAVPDAAGPVPAVVLVHGFGSHDPDGTVGATRMLADLAHGLASEGIATLRYAKRLHDHEVADANRTLDRVVTDDAVVALSTLADAEAVDPERLFVVGHSQGGLCAPRIAERHGGLAGVVALDPPADPVPDPDDMVRTRFMLALDGDLDDEQQAALDAQRETFRRIADREIEPEETVAGVPGAWHLSHHDYDPLGTACALDVPSFVLKTGRADRETQADLFDALRENYETWRDADLPPGSRVEFYDDVCHYFQPGPTPVTPMRLYVGGNVAADVLADIADWVHGVADTDAQESPT